MNLVLWWHMHQPDYRDSNGEFMLPWVYLHTIKDYIDMPLNIMANSGMKANINITPVLIDQWQDYNFFMEKALNEVNLGKAVQFLPDSFLRPLLLEKLDDKLKSWMAAHYIWVNYERMVCRFENYKRIYDIVSSDLNLSYLNDNFYFDLCVWFHLAWCGECIKKYDPIINYFFKKGHNFTLDDRRLLLKRLAEWMKYGLSLYGFSSLKGGKTPDWPPEFPSFIEKKKLKELKSIKAGSYSVTLSPGYHPIIPLLIDVHAGAISAQMTNINYEQVEISNYLQGLESARTHLEMTDKYFNACAFNLAKRKKNKTTKGEEGADGGYRALWPSEGAISSQSLDLFNDYNIKICASGEEILSISMGMNVHGSIFMNGRGRVPLYNVYRWKDTDIKMIFRDSGLSDLIGFTYAKWRGDDAANDLIAKLHAIDDFDKDAVVSIILDGENAWEYYYENGFYFLNDLYSLITSSIKINPLLIEEVYNSVNINDCIKLDYIYPGSWVNGNLRMWVGEEQKNKAWELLNKAKTEFIEWKNALKSEINGNEPIVDRKIYLALRQLMAAEGSDWFWWLGKDSPIFSQSAMEKIFRNFLKNIYSIMNKPAPDYIFNSLASTERTGLIEVGGMMRRGHE